MLSRTIFIIFTYTVDGDSWGRGFANSLFFMCLWALHEMLPTPKTKCPRLATFYQKLTIPKGLPHLGFPFYKQLKVILFHMGLHTSLSSCLLIILLSNLMHITYDTCIYPNVIVAIEPFLTSWKKSKFTSYIARLCTLLKCQWTTTLWHMQWNMCQLCTPILTLDCFKLSWAFKRLHLLLQLHPLNQN
jgi:hypothetical protein